MIGVIIAGALLGINLTSVAVQNAGKLALGSLFRGDNKANGVII